MNFTGITLKLNRNEKECLTLLTFNLVEHLNVECLRYKVQTNMKKLCLVTLYSLHKRLWNKEVRDNKRRSYTLKLEECLALHEWLNELPLMDDFAIVFRTDLFQIIDRKLK